jgi:hypothetical protein
MVAPIQSNRPRFNMGQIVATPGALRELEQSGESPAKLLTRHSTGDWGEVDGEDCRLNDKAVMEGTRLLSAYRTAKGERLWIITEADRSVTTLLLPSEY